MIFSFEFFTIFREIVVIVFVLEIFRKTNHDYVIKLLQSIQSIVNVIIIFNFSSTKSRAQTQTRNIKISSIESIKFFFEWTIDRFVFKIVIRRFHVIIVEYKITSNYLKFLSINFRIEKISFFKNTFVEKQSQIRLSLDEFRAFNYFFITNC